MVRRRIATRVDDSWQRKVTRVATPVRGSHGVRLTIAAVALAEPDSRTDAETPESAVVDARPPALVPMAVGMLACNDARRPVVVNESPPPVADDDPSPLPLVDDPVAALDPPTTEAVAAEVVDPDEARPASDPLSPPSTMSHGTLDCSTTVSMVAGISRESCTRARARVIAHDTQAAAHCAGRGSRPWTETPLPSL